MEIVNTLKILINNSNNKAMLNGPRIIGVKDLIHLEKYENLSGGLTSLLNLKCHNRYHI